MKTKSCIFLFAVMCYSHVLIAGPLSIAGMAKVTASSELNTQSAAKNVIDGVMAVEGKGCWMAKGEKRLGSIKLEEFTVREQGCYLQSTFAKRADH